MISTLEVLTFTITLYPIIGWLFVAKSSGGLYSHWVCTTHWSMHGKFIVTLPYEDDADDADIKTIGDSGAPIRRAGTMFNEIRLANVCDVGLVFIFNLIVGTGALTLPAIFVKAGWILSMSVVMVLALISYITVTFIVEAMACANAIKTWQDLQVLKRHVDSNEDEYDSDASLTSPLLPRIVENDSQEVPCEVNSGSRSRISYANSVARLERMPLYVPTTPLQYYKLDEKFEMGEMAVLFFNDAGRLIFYLCITVYLYGDLSIYTAAVAKSLRDVACDTLNATLPSNTTNGSSSNENLILMCWSNHTLSRFDVYRLFSIGFTMLLGPFALFSVQKTKNLQMLTVIFRWLAFSFMIAIAIKVLIFDGAKGHPVAFNVGGLPVLFGACVYSFMCHHSLPSLLAPMREKAHLRSLLCGDYILICAFYLLLALTGIFAFVHLEDLYTLNFVPNQRDVPTISLLLAIINYFLALFPVLTLSSSYPILAITLCNNLKTLFLDLTRFESYNFFVRNLLFPLLAILPPFLITYFTENLTSLVGFTGSYAGAAIQYLIPIALVYFARRTCKQLLGNGVTNDFQSPFKNEYWLIFVFVWALACMCLVTINFLIKSKQSM